MKRKKYISTTIIFLTGLFFLMLPTACHKDLDVDYLNQPDVDKIYSDPENIYNITADGFFNWFMTMNSSISPRMAMWVAADQGTCSWANSGMYHLSDEPRRPFNNDVSYTYASTFSTYYSGLYTSLKRMNNVLKKLDEGMIIGNNGKDTKLVRSFAHFIQGLSLGYLGLVYDQAVIVTENVDPYTAKLSPYQTVLDSAIVCLEKSIDVAAHANFKVPETWINGYKYDEDELIELAKSFIVRFKVYGARNKAQNDAIDWQKVLDLANEGIQKGLEPYMDNIRWFCYYKHYTTSRDGWARIDSRIIHLMDPNYPSRFPADGHNPAPAVSDDARLQTDFGFAASNNMKPERGYVHYSNYEFKRYSYTTSSSNPGPVSSFPLAENDLFKAEAHARLGHLADAINIVNAGTRVTRGHLSPLPMDASKEEILKAIFYERDIELIQTGFGNDFFDMRRRDYLQEGTPLHFPVPARELEVMQLPLYTFGGVAHADGINTSNGGWDK